MKRKLTAAALTLCLLLGLLSGCSRKGGNSDNGDDAVERSIYWLSSHPEAEASLLELAKEYESVSGVSITIKCVAPGEYDEALKNAIYSDEPPVLFECSGLDDMREYYDRCGDLAGSAAAEALSDSSLALIYKDQTRAIPLGTEYCGLLINRSLLGQAGFDEVSIADLAFLRSAAEFIHENADELGFDAFAPASLSSDSAPDFAKSLANMALYYEPTDVTDWSETPAQVSGSSLEQLREFWDMYLALSSTDTEHIADGSVSPIEAFAKGEAVFCIGSSSDAAVLTAEYGMSADDIGMVPLYFGVNDEQQGLCEKACGYLAVNAPAAVDVVSETLDFLEWLTCSERGLELMTQAFGQLPYKNAPESGDSFTALAGELKAQGKDSVSWVYGLASNASDWYAVFAHALGLYSQGDDWERVESAFIDGWEVQYVASQNN